MSEAKTLYSSGIDNQAKYGGFGDNARTDHKELKKTNFSIGDTKGSIGGSEATSQFKSMTGAHAAAQNKKKALDMIEKLKTNNISFKEQKQGGQINNYYQSSAKQNFKDQGYCRRVIPDEQKKDARAAHYSLGFE